jgi:hypothetical protein
MSLLRSTYRPEPENDRFRRLKLQELCQLVIDSYGIALFFAWKEYSGRNGSD